MAGTIAAMVLRKAFVLPNSLVASPEMLRVKQVSRMQVISIVIRPPADLTIFVLSHRELAPTSSALVKVFWALPGCFVITPFPELVVPIYACWNATPVSIGPTRTQGR